MTTQNLIGAILQIAIPFLIGLIVVIWGAKLTRRNERISMAIDEHVPLDRIPERIADSGIFTLFGLVMIVWSLIRLAILLTYHQ